MKKYIIPAAFVLVICLVLSLLCYYELGSFNFVRTGLGLTEIMMKGGTVVQIADFPHKAYLVTPDDGYAVFKDYLASEGYELLEHEQMGSQFQVERDGQREYVYWSANAFFHKWIWE